MLAVVGYGFFGHGIGSEPKSLRDAGFSPVSGFDVETSAFRFEMPDTPKIEPVSISRSGVELTGKVWTIETRDMTLQVLAVEYQRPLDENTAQAVFDALVKGMARRAGGEVVTDQPFQLAGGSARRTEIKIDGGRIFTENYSWGNWAVSIFVGSASENPPTAYTDLIASFKFL